MSNDNTQINTHIFSQQRARVFLACMFIILRVAFVVTQYNLTPIGALIGYSAILIMQIILSLLFVTKQFRDNPALGTASLSLHSLSDEQDPGFFYKNWSKNALLYISCPKNDCRSFTCFVSFLPRFLIFIGNGRFRDFAIYNRIPEALF